MEKIITCMKCMKTFTVSGPYSGAKEVPQGVTCPFCGEPNEVKWPMDAGLTTIPKKPSASLPVGNKGERKAQMPKVRAHHDACGTRVQMLLSDV